MEEHPEENIEIMIRPGIQQKIKNNFTREKEINQDHVLEEDQFNQELL